MDSKKIAIVIIIIGLCVGVTWIIFSGFSKEDDEDINTNISLRETIKNLTPEERQSLLNIQNGSMNEELPQAIKDILFPPAFEKGIDKMLGND